MTRKDYILIARALLYAREDCRGRKVMEAGVWVAAAQIANTLQETCPRFDRLHFLAVVRGERALESWPPRKKKVVVLSARGLRLADDPHAAGCAAGKREGAL